MLTLFQNNQATATLTKLENEWELCYLPSAELGITPKLKTRVQPYRIPNFPRFLESLLPKGARRTLAGQKHGIGVKDIERLAQYCLANENVGNLRVQGAKLPAPTCIHYVPSLQKLLEPEVRQELDEKIKQTDGNFGIGGVWPKTFLNSDEGTYLLKKYPDFETSGAEIARCECAALAALRSIGQPATDAQVIGDYFLSRRFDTIEGKKLPICHLADLMDLDPLQGSYEQLAQQLATHVSQEETKQFALQLLFAWVIGDSNHHAENFALIANKGTSWQLAPAYDLLPSKFLTNDSDQLALTINEKKTNLSLKDFREVLKLAQISQAEAQAFCIKAIKAASKLLLPAMPETHQGKLRKHLSMLTLVVHGEQALSHKQNGGPGR